MKKKLLLFLCLTAMVFILFACDKETNKDNTITNEQGLEFFLQDDGTYAVGAGSAKLLSKIVIPETYQGKPVTAISSETISCGFQSCSNLIEIEIPSSVVGIGKNAFDGCTGLTSVIIPDSVTSIGDSAFAHCSALTSVVIPDNVTSIGDYVFAYCSALTSVVIPDNVTSIGDYAFQNCSGLISVVIPDNVTSIGGSAFDYCSGLTSVVIGSGVESIGDFAFTCCYKLVEVYNKSSLPITKGNWDYGYVGSYAKEIYTSDYVSKLSTDKDGYIIYTDGTDKILMGYTGQETELTLPTGITEIYQRAFYEQDFFKQSDITSVVIPDSVTRIGLYAFYNCSKITSVVIGNGVTSIGDYAFEYCSGLASVVIGNSVTSIGSNAFYSCSGLTSVTFENTSGWYITYDPLETSGTAVIVTDPSQNGTYLNATYCYYYWKRK